MSELQRIAPDTLRIERLLDAPVETVWRWLVEPELRAQWFAGGSTIGDSGEFVLLFDHDNLSSDPVPYPDEYAKWKGDQNHERVLHSEPPHRLTYTWMGGRQGQVTFELQPQDGKTRLVLTHSGINGPAPYASFSGGWMSHLTVLQTRLAGGRVRDFWALHLRSIAAVKATLGAA